MKFYLLQKVLGDPYDTDAEFVVPKDVGPAPKCPQCGRYVGMLVALPPYKFELTLFGPEPGDLMRCSGDSWLASSRFRQVCEAAGVTGVQFAPAEIVRVRRRDGKRRSLQLPSGFSHMTVTRGRAALDVARSEAEFPFVECAECRSMRQLVRAKRIVLEDGSWDGLDMFIARGFSGRVLVTERVEALCRESDLKNVSFVDAESHSFDSMPWLK